MQKATSFGNESFVTQRVNETSVKDSWQQHTELELILFIQGSGVAYIGEYEEKYETGDIYFLGSNLPHAFKNIAGQMNAIVVQFNDNYFGNRFLTMPEYVQINKLFNIATHGLRIIGNSKIRLEVLIRALEKSTAINRIIILLQCLEVITTANEYVILSSQKVKKNYQLTESIKKVLEYTDICFQDAISLSKVSGIACMSIPSFCRLFKRCINKTYIDYLNEVRIHYACRQLQETQKSVTEICYESGYNTIVHFHRQFLKSTTITPLQYRKKFTRGVKTEECGSLKMKQYKIFNVAC